MKALNSNRFILLSILTFLVLLTGCTSSEPKVINYADYGLPIEMSTPGNVEIINKSVDPLPSSTKLYQVDVTDNEQYGVYISMYDKDISRTVSEVISDDLDFEKQYATANKKELEIIKQEKSGYLFKTDAGYDFYWYVLKDNKLITITADTTKEKASLQDVEFMFDLAKTAL